MDTLLKKGLRLSLYFFLLIFLSGRIGLMLHEFGGHALSCLMLGGEVQDFKLFVFGGGRIHWHVPASAESAFNVSQLIVELSGIACELIVGILLGAIAIVTKGGGRVKDLVVALSTIFVVHPLFYLVVCTYYGAGDGQTLFSVLTGSGRTAFLGLTYGLTVAGAFILSFAFSPMAKGWVVTYTAKRDFLIFVMSAIAAIVFHGALTLTERFLVRDTTYEALKSSRNEQSKHKEISQRINAYIETYGEEPDQDYRAAVENELEKKYRQFPMEIPLGASVVVAFIMGFILSKHRQCPRRDPIVRADFHFLGGLSAGSLFLLLIASR